MSDADTTGNGGSIEVGVRFRHNPKVYSFTAQERLTIGDRVLVRSEKGVDLGEVMEIKGRVSQERAEALMPVVRKATGEDLEHIREQDEREKRAMKICAEKIEEHSLPMKLIDASLSFDNTRLMFFFSADGRVDFRELVRDLARTFRLRIELRQIGVRDEAKLLGGLGPCGRRLCCKTFMKDFEPVGIRVAKDQGLALNPNKISGLCDRLMCCLLFEHEAYVTARKKMPARGDRVHTPHGPGVVTDVALLCERVTVELEDGKEMKLQAEELGPRRKDSASPKAKEGSAESASGEGTDSVSPPQKEKGEGPQSRGGGRGGGSRSGRGRRGSPRRKGQGKSGGGRSE